SMPAQPDETLLHEAETIIRHMEAIRAILDMAEEQDIASSGLTLPQIAVLRQLTVQDGLSLKELSERLGLAHSTVSGIVDRLERLPYLRIGNQVRDHILKALHWLPIVGDSNIAAQNQVTAVDNRFLRSGLESGCCCRAVGRDRFDQDAMCIRR